MSAHPDDIALGCGGSIAKHIKIGDKVFLLFLTKGEEAGDPEIRVKETIKSSAILGVLKNNLYFAEVPDTRISENLRRAILEIEKIVDKHNPFRVYTSSIKDRHQDHVATATATKAACRHIPQLLAYETPSSLSEFSPQVFIDISETLPLKTKAIKLHQSQTEKSYVKAEAVEGLARFRGLQAEVKAAEAFEVYRMIL